MSLAFSFTDLMLEHALCNDTIMLCQSLHKTCESAAFRALMIPPQLLMHCFPQALRDTPALQLLRSGSWRILKSCACPDSAQDIAFHMPSHTTVCSPLRLSDSYKVDNRPRY